MRLSLFFFLLFVVMPFFPSPAISDSQKITKATSMAEFGEPLYAEDIAYYPYVNPDAPKGGKITLGAFGTYDSLNSYILKGNYPSSIGLTSDSLMTGSGDELLAAYCLIAESVEYPEDESWIIFNLRSEAKYHDGVTITAGDFVFTLETINNHGRPFLRSFYADVKKAEALSDKRLKFTFTSKNSMKPLMKVAGLSPLPRHYWQNRDITKTTLEPPLASGSYRISKLDAGRSITYERVKDYWGKDLPVNIGTANIDTIHYDYYRDMDVMFVAFTAGKIDFWSEFQSKRWATGYDIPQIKNGQMIKESLPNATPQGIQAYFFNLRHAKFSDVRVREAIGLLFDFETTRRTVLFDQYARTKNFFPNSDYGATGNPTPEEIAILSPYAESLKPEILSKAFEPSKTDGSGRIRNQIRKALRLFKSAGWNFTEGKLKNVNGEQLSVEFLIRQPSSERIIAPFIQNLKKVGIAANIRLVDTSQYENRTDNFDFDILSVKLNFFPPPGPELRSYYGSQEAEVKGSANMAGIKNQVVDALIEQIISAKDLATLKATTRAMDRVLLWNHYVIPQFHNDIDRVAYWNKFSRPERKPKYSIGFPSTWWIDINKEKKLK